jgi:hypothetical protein
MPIIVIFDCKIFGCLYLYIFTFIHRLVGKTIILSHLYENGLKNERGVVGWGGGGRQLCMNTN